VIIYRRDFFYLVNTTCKGQCPEARGYYIGLKRQIDENELSSSSSKWIWSNNVTWTQNDTDVSLLDIDRIQDRIILLIVW
jgi:hypothetical protein